MAYATSENLDSNIYVGNTKHGNICLCLNNDKKITNAFPTLTNKEHYINIKQKIKEVGLGEPDEMHLQVITLFFCIDLLNNKELITKKLNSIPQNFSFDLFECYIDKEMTIISTESGKLMINTTYVKNFLLNNIIE